MASYPNSPTVFELSRVIPDFAAMISSIAQMVTAYIQNIITR
jgi:hypothetical protein